MEKLFTFCHNSFSGWFMDLCSSKNELGHPSIIGTLCSMTSRFLFRLFLLVSCLSLTEAYSQNAIVSAEFIYDSASFTSCHAATIAETPAGMVAAWFGGSGEGNADVNIWVSHYQHGHWTAPVMAADGRINESTRYACYNPVLYQQPRGPLLLFYKIGPNVQGWTGWMKRSNDNGLHWGPAEALPKGILGPIKNKPVLIKGILVCPSSTEDSGWRSHFEYTKDWGKHWKKSVPLNDGKMISAIQPSILSYRNGRLQAIFRSMNSTVNTAWSRDGGLHWSPVVPTELPNNNSGLDAITLMDERQLMVYNHVKPPPGADEGRGARTPLNIALSSDGIHWKMVLVLENTPGEFSYPSAIQSKDGLVHIVYTWNRVKIKHVVIDPKKLAN